MTAAYKTAFDAACAVIAAYKPNSKDDTLTYQQALSGLVKLSTSVEREYRAKVVELYEIDGAPGKSGTENVDIGWGHKLKIVRKLEYKLDTSDDCAKVDLALDKIEKSMEGGSIISERLVKWKPELSLTEYKLLSPANKAIIDSVLTIKDASATVELIAPKTAT